MKEYNNSAVGMSDRQIFASMNPHDLKVHLQNAMAIKASQELIIDTINELMGVKEDDR